MFGRETSRISLSTWWEEALGSQGDLWGDSAISHLPVGKKMLTCSSEYSAVGKVCCIYYAIFPNIKLGVMRRASEFTSHCFQLNSSQSEQEGTVPVYACDL